MHNQRCLIKKDNQPDQSAKTFQKQFLLIKTHNLKYEMRRQWGTSRWNTLRLRSARKNSRAASKWGPESNHTDDNLSCFPLVSSNVGWGGVRTRLDDLGVGRIEGGDEWLKLEVSKRRDRKGRRQSRFAGGDELGVFPSSKPHSYDLVERRPQHPTTAGRPA